MQHLIDATRQAVKNENWHAALALALTMPDICARIQYPELKNRSEQRYVQWFDKYLAANYIGGLLPTPFMQGGDLYALRCAYLHQGEMALDGHKAKKLIERFRLTVPGPGVFHRNRTGTMDEHGNISDMTLQLSVDMFCDEICTAVESWLKDVNSDPRIQSGIANLGQMGSFGNL